ncbi:MAG: ribosome small subunit-dependent GTPase A [Flavobacteriales bacterium]|nr:ribosome small subunit-dependent GTPase A [Flavobacteriales bacterium]
MKGLVLKSTGSHYLVRNENGEVFTCRVRGKMRLEGMKTTNPVAVGDHVTMEERTGEWWIAAVDKRKNYIIRKATKLSSQRHIIAANIDRAFLIVTADHPRTSHGFIDRFLVTAEAYHIPVTLVFNKADLFEGTSSGDLNEMVTLYESIGYPVLVISALHGDVEKLRAAMLGKVNLLSGHSGVGKSTLIKSLDPTLDPVTRQISTVHNKGMHATTFAEMHPMKGGGYMIDTPGIKELGVVDIPREEVSHYFIEMRKLLPGCRFNNCLHVNEPGCAVIRALEEGTLHATRYQSYLGILEGE